MTGKFDGEEITVRKLIAILRNCPPEAIVNVEGCDCAGRAIGVISDGDKVKEMEIDGKMTLVSYGDDVQIVRDDGVDGCGPGDPRLIPPE